LESLSAARPYRTALFLNNFNNATQHNANRNKYIAPIVSQFITYSRALLKYALIPKAFSGTSNLNTSIAGGKQGSGK
jgi:hypothetical protein